MLTNPWKRAIEAERRAIAAEDRAAFLEQQLEWMKNLVHKSRDAEIVALKVGWNVASETAFRFSPFPEVPSIPQQDEGLIRELESQSLSAKDEAKVRLREFKRSEMARFNVEHQKANG